MKSLIYAPGLRVIIRDAEWIIKQVNPNSTGGFALSVVGLSELVKDKEAIFLTDMPGENIEIVDSTKTELVVDSSPYYRESFLYLESLLRQTPPTNNNIYTGNKAAIDVVPYQLDPAIQSLAQPRQRILMADAVGLGKTIEVGILLSELIKRGRGKRILVLALKSMLTQFQKELWSRFSIPLVRLDSVGIQRIKNKIPTNHNPFYYFDKTIISIDTLKQDTEYRNYIENSYWDIIVIDEAHNVAERSTGSQRSKLAKLLSSRSDSLLLLTATPHDGKKKSFASLMNMLNPTAIADPEDYGPEDIKGLFIRRFKKDIKHQVSTSFRERDISTAKAKASSIEEEAYDILVNMTFTKISNRRFAGSLIKTTIEKALFSSPAACLQTVNNRIAKLKKESNTELEKDIQQLSFFSEALKKISPEDFAKYQKLLDVITSSIHGMDWNGKDPLDRLVIFTERIETMKFLAKNLRIDLGLKENEIVELSGEMNDIDQQRIVEDFGNEASKIKILVASDVASEGINLHFLSHKMIHFDIPWSLMVFQQRNGRIDRYGQERDPRIIYLVTESDNEKIKGDTRILELLIEKDEQAVKNIGDPSILMGVYDIDAEEKIVEKAIEGNKGVKEFDSFLEKEKFDPLELLLGKSKSEVKEDSMSFIAAMPTLYENDYEFFKDALNHIRKSKNIQTTFNDDEKTVSLTLFDELLNRYKTLPSEILPSDNRIYLTLSRDLVQNEIKKCRQEENRWPEINLLWEQHPIMQWINDKMLASFGRNEAPVISLTNGLDKEETIFVLTGLIPNRKGHPLINNWFGIKFKDDKYSAILTFDEIEKETKLSSKQFPNQQIEFNLLPIKNLLQKAIEKAHEHMHGIQVDFENKINDKLNKELKALEELQARHNQQIEFEFADEGLLTTNQLDKKAQQKREIKKIFNEFITWIEDTMTTEDNPYIRVVAVLRREQ